MTTIKEPLLDPTGLDPLIAAVKSQLKDELVILKDVEVWIPTGIPQFDIALGGGVPVGRLTTLIGAKSVGKSTLTVHIMAQIQKMAGIPVGLDVERSNLKTRCEAQGLDLAKALFTQPDSLDTYEVLDVDTGKKKKVKGAFDIMTDILRVIRKSDPNRLTGFFLDSVAGSSVASEMEGDVGSATMGKHARVLSQAFRMIMPSVYDMACVFVLVNQLKEKIGVVYGDPKTYIGKNPIDFHSAITVEMTSGGPFPSKTDPRGITTKAYISKNKVANPFGRVEWVTWFDRGIDVLWEQIAFLKTSGRLGASAGFYEWDGKKYRQNQLYDLAGKDPEVLAGIAAMAKEATDEQITRLSLHAPGA